MDHGVLALYLEARPAHWRPEGPHGPDLAVFAFAEEGHTPLVPGPLVRVPAGTEIRATLRNWLPKALVVRGLQEHPATTLDSVSLAPGETRSVRFQADTPGIYYYWGRTTRNDAFGIDEDSQLVGAIVVDPPAPPGPPGDRVFVITYWQDPTDTIQAAEHMPRGSFMVNGLSWPHTEQLTYTVGDTVRWRLINASIAVHPMHLHGFYFRVDRRGTAARDTAYAPIARRLAVTELVRAGTTMSLTWSPDRPGNWLFHCHLNHHIAAGRRLEQPPPATAVSERDRESHAMDAMAGLVVGLHVRPASGRPTLAPPVASARTFRLFVDERPAYFGDDPAYAFVLQEGDRVPAADSIRIPGPPLLLTRGEPTEITVFNRSTQPVSIHWHGIELESYYDGVADWSGVAGRTAPQIAPGDSFVVRFTPPRAGTFIYHTHNDDHHQLSSGLHGALLVLEPGQPRHTVTDRILLLDAGGPKVDAPPMVNGSPTPPPLDLDAGVTYRLRLINITADDVKRVALLADTTAQQWRPLGKDGADLPAVQTDPRAARVLMGPGETNDFAFTSPSGADLTLEITTLRFRQKPSVMRVPVHVH